jgi:LDH2 family malate/lactate/ureidoglycolate dehydrogenase/aryl carrier-like protein
LVSIAGGKPAPVGSFDDLDEVRTRTEETLLEIWRQILRNDTLRIDQNFFDAGGDSILAIQIVTQAIQAGLEIDLRQFYQHQTIRELAAIAVERSARRRLVGTMMEENAEIDQNAEIIVSVASLRAFGQEALERAGLAAEGARIVTEVQLEASLRGQLTHHIGSIPRYARRIAAGKINPRPRICVELETANSAKIDGDNGPGQWVGAVAMQTAIQKSKTAGIGIVTVRRSNHFGAAGHYAWQAAQAGLIGLCTTNGPVILAPTGGITPTFGNNPLAVGIPSGRHRPILLDIALSVAPRGKIGVHLAAGKPLPPGWIMDRRGRHSTNLADLASGLGVPIGEHKGYGLTLVMEILAGVLSGAAFGWDHCREQIRQYAQPPDIGHFFLAIDPQLFLSLEEFTARVDLLIDQAKGGERAEHVDEILIPGESELRARERSLSEGVRLSADTYQALRKYAAEAGLATELEDVMNSSVLENGLG